MKLGWKFWEDTENYSSGSSYQDALINAIFAQAQGDLNVRAQTTAAVEFGVGLIERCFAIAEIEPEYLNSMAITPLTLSRMARQLLLVGNSVNLIDTAGGELLVIPVANYQVSGGIRERSWRYRVEVQGPTSRVSRTVPATSIVHVRMGSRPAEPWRGYSPLRNAGVSARMLGMIEERMGQEATARVGHLLTIADGLADDQVKQLRLDLAALKGDVALAETGNAGHGQGMRGAAQVDWLLRRIGAHFPAENLQARSDISKDIIAALGIPPPLYHGTDGVSAREAYRLLLVSTLQPIAELISSELSKKLDTTVEIKFRRLQAADIQSRARAFGSMVAAGVDEKIAMEVSGLET